MPDNEKDEKIEKVPAFAMTEARMEILKHATGWTKSCAGRVVSDRNHYAMGPDGDSWADCKALVAAGLMKEGALINEAPDQMRYFHVTAAGRVEIARHHAEALKKSFVVATRDGRAKAIETFTKGQLVDLLSFVLLEREVAERKAEK